MDCLQLQLQPHQVRTQPFHYLINEQAKSLLALQELQNEVGALLEFRDLVMETFPNLRQKMSSGSPHNFSNTGNYCSNLPLSGSLNSRQWEPGIKVKRKIINKADSEASFGRVRSNSHSSKIQSSQPKSSEAISGVQDSGFSTETNSSNKDQGSSTATSVPLPVQTDDPFLTRKETGSQKDSRRSEYDRSDEELSEDGLVLKVNEAEEELWNLLDVIHTKGTKLREEVETLQLRLVVEEIENHLREKELEIKKAGRKFNRRCRSLDSLGETSSSTSFLLENEGVRGHDVSFDVFPRKRTRSIELEDVDHIREERDMLLDKLAEMETESVANRIKTSELQNEISALINTKEELQEQLLQAMKQKNELNSRIHELHLKFVTGDRKNRKSDSRSPADSESSQLLSDASSLSKGKPSDTETNSKAVNLVDSERHKKLKLIKNLGALDGIVSNPRRFKKYCKLSELSRKKLEAILKERNYLELQRHLLVSVVENQALNQQLETSIKSHGDLCEQLDRYKKENDELLFQLEEKNIELEGTRAQVRVLEKLQQQSRPPVPDTRQTADPPAGENFTFLENDHLRSKGFSESEITRARQIFLESQNKKTDSSEVSKIRNSTPQRIPEQKSFDLGKTTNVIPILALPLPGMASHHSSEMESTHALEISSELEADLARVDKSDRSPYRRRPSKIPLNIQKNGKSLLKSGATSLKKDGEPSKSKDSRKSLENSHNSITSRNPNSMKYSSVGRTSSQLSMASQRSHSSSKVDRRKSLTPSREDSSAKQTTGCSNRQGRESLSRKNDCSDGSGKQRTVRSSFRESFRSRISIDGNSACAKKDASIGNSGRKDSLQLRQSRSGSVQQKNNTNKSILSGESDKFPKHSRRFASGDEGLLAVNGIDNAPLEGATDATAHTCQAGGTVNLQETLPNSQPQSIKQDSDVYSDSLNQTTRQTKQERYNLFREVRQNFQRRLAEKFSQTFSSRREPPAKNVWNCPRVDGDFVCGETRRTVTSEMDFFDSIDNSVDVDRDDSLLINSGYYCRKAGANEAMAEADSLEVRLEQDD